MLSLLLDLESMLGVPEGFVAREALARYFGDQAVRVAQESGLVRFYDRPCAAGFSVQGGRAVGLTARGRMLAAYPAGSVYPFELAAESHEIVSAVLCGAAV